MAQKHRQANERLNQQIKERASIPELKQKQVTSRRLLYTLGVADAVDAGIMMGAIGPGTDAWDTGSKVAAGVLGAGTVVAMGRHIKNSAKYWSAKAKSPYYSVFQKV